MFVYVCTVGDSNENKPEIGADDEEVAKMGCPSLGEHIRLEVVIEESYEFKVELPLSPLSWATMQNELRKII